MVKKHTGPFQLFSFCAAVDRNVIVICFISILYLTMGGVYPVTVTFLLGWQDWESLKVCVNFVIMPGDFYTSDGPIIFLNIE